MSKLHIGTAAWNLPALARDRFPAEGSVLERYAQKFSTVEINSSFYRDHQGKTYRRWAESVPSDFRFVVKLSKQFTHAPEKLLDPAQLSTVCAAYHELGAKWGALLVQLPPKAAFTESRAADFFSELRRLYSGPVALEPRHLSWVSEAAQRLRERFGISKVIADPDPCPLALAEALRGSSFAYFRLHGSPEIYRSSYSPSQLSTWQALIRQAERLVGQCYCIFDNTTFGAATLNALSLQTM